jgi:hypothetical protein
MVKINSFVDKIPKLRYIGRKNIYRINCSDKVIAEFIEENKFTYQPQTYKQFYDCIRSSEDIVLYLDSAERQIRHSHQLLQTDEDIANLVNYEANKRKSLEEKTLDQFAAEAMFKLQNKIACGEINEIPDNINDLVMNEAKENFKIQLMNKTQGIFSKIKNAIIGVGSTKLDIEESTSVTKTQVEESVFSTSKNHNIDIVDTMKIKQIDPR